MENYEKVKYWDKAVCGGKRKQMLTIHSWDELPERRMHNDVRGGSGIKSLIQEMKGNTKQ